MVYMSTLIMSTRRTSTKSAAAVSSSSSSSLESSSSSSSRRRRRSCRSEQLQVYVAAVPLRASKGPAQMIMSAAYSLNLNLLWDLQHFIVIINSSSSSSSALSAAPVSQAMAFDFQPQDPENIFIALAALSGQKVPGVVLMRKLKKVPTSKCWFVGYSSRVDDAMAATTKFNKQWNTDLRIGYHDCRNYTNGLVEYLTGDTCVLDHLRRKHAAAAEDT